MGNSETVKQVAFVRSINVGSHNRIKMETLRGVFEGLGCTEVQTYLQTGNVCFETSKKDIADRVQVALESINIRKAPVIVRPVENLKSIANGDPFAGFEKDRFHQMVVFLSAPVKESELIGHDWKDGALVRASSTEVLLALPRIGPPPNPIPAIERRWKVSATARFWNVVVDFAKFCSA